MGDKTREVSVDMNKLALGKKGGHKLSKLGDR